jgi:hypothetical protein
MLVVSYSVMEDEVNNPILITITLALALALALTLTLTLFIKHSPNANTQSSYFFKMMRKDTLNANVSWPKESILSELISAERFLCLPTSKETAKLEVESVNGISNALVSSAWILEQKK